MNKTKIDFTKNADGLVPAIIQDANTDRVLMLGYMNEESYQKTIQENIVTFFSRSRKQLWTKGETSGNFLMVKEILPDCDSDTLLIKATPAGPVCHTGKDTCFDETNKRNFISELENIIEERKKAKPDTSYTASLFQKGAAAIAQKVGEEAVEVVIEAMRNDEERFRNEAADLMYHYLVLLHSRGYTLNDISEVLRQRHEAK